MAATDAATIFGYNMSDVGLGLQGLGSLAGAWGAYEMGRQRNNLIKDQLNYQKQRDALLDAKLEERDDAIRTAFGYDAPADTVPGV